MSEEMGMTQLLKTHEREITSPVDLCNPNGALNDAAVGWTRFPLHRANLPGWGRNKRFEYWCIISDSHVLALNVSHADYRVTNALFCYDRRSGAAVTEADITWLPRSGNMSDNARAGTTVSSGRRTYMKFRTRGEQIELHGSGTRIVADLSLQRPADHECSAIVARWSRNRYQYNLKDNWLPVTGRAFVDGELIEFDPARSRAIYDFGRGKWPYRITWNWGAAMGEIDGQPFALNIGAKWTDGTGATENAVRLGNTVFKIGQELTWDYDPANFMRPWRISGQGIDLSFAPIYDRSSDFNRVLVRSREHQVFGEYSGWLDGPDGTRLTLDRFFGFAEEVYRRW